MTTSETSAPGQAPHDATAANQTALRVLRAITLLVAFLWGAYMLTQFRTMDYGWYPAFKDVGSRLASFGVAFAVFVLPAAVVLGYRRQPRRWLRVVVGVCLASFLFAEAWAGLEEAAFRRDARELAAATADADVNPADLPLAYLYTNSLSRKTVFRNRWWPFTHHTLYYDPQAGLFGGHDSGCPPLHQDGSMGRVSQPGRARHP